MSDSADDLEEVQRRLKDIQRSKRGRIQWKIGKHTAEMAIGAIEERPPKSERKNGKSRRRQKKKRLL